MSNERKTENYVRKILTNNKEDYPYATIEEQKSDNPRINKLLKNASKSGGGVGKPEFIVSFENEPELLLVVECKADINKHKSKILDQYRDYAVDGVLLYSSFLSKEFNVIAIAVSGEKEEEIKISTYLQFKNKKYQEDKLKEIVGFNDYVSLFQNSEEARMSPGELKGYSKELNNKLRDDFELEEGQRPLLVSGILIALENEAFETSYLKHKSAKQLSEALIRAISNILEDHKLDTKKKEDIINTYSFIITNNNISEDLNGKRNTKLRDLITEIKGKVQPYIRGYQFHDVLGQFYGEFLRYANGDKGLGILLTPRHITELFSDIAEVNKDTVVIDNCCGTAGFLISAMRKMIDDAGTNRNKINHIYDKQIIGIENNAKMFCLACSNMLLRGDGKSNIHYNDCFTIDKNKIISLNPTVGFLNPPYSKKKEGSEELSYVLNCLDFLEKNGICVAIVPMSCATSPSIFKQKLLEKHTLEAVMSMPKDLFYPQGTVTCIMVFKAGVPHEPKKESWFGYWKEDGFEKTKKYGRIDKNEVWDKIKKEWVEMFLNRKEINSKSIKKKVTANDEWCAEAYMETDYSNIKEEEFTKEIKKYVLFNLNNEG
ncbi:MAG: N-6 DNA methylase [Candidatus Nanoarchaeia archaeon]|nr:N-6 DNA methylase [Candidatus Nanoarchaeia archaeon]